MRRPRRDLEGVADAEDVLGAVDARAQLAGEDLEALVLARVKMPRRRMTVSQFEETASEASASTVSTPAPQPTVSTLSSRE